MAVLFIIKITLSSDPFEKFYVIVLYEYQIVSGLLLDPVIAMDLDFLANRT